MCLVKAKMNVPAKYVGLLHRYTVELMTLPPKPQQTLTLTCVVRQAVAVDIQLGFVKWLRVLQNRMDLLLNGPRPFLLC
jgi:hypothetical protein